MKKETVFIKNKAILNRGLYRWAAPRSVFVRGLIHNRIQDLQRSLCLLRNSMRGRFQIKFGMTPLFNKGAFTLIELLVVVLIIGILAAIALPQYQKAVLKSRFTKLVTTSKSIVDAQRIYYMDHGVYANRADLLDITFPLTNGGTNFGDGRTWSCIFNYANGVGGDPRTSCDLFSPRMTLQWYHTRGSAICCVYASSNFAGEWLCQKITKKQTPYQAVATSHCYSGRR